MYNTYTYPERSKSEEIRFSIKEMHMVSYTDNGYRLRSLEDRRIICERDVIFDETKFLTNIQRPYVETSEDSNSNLSVE